MDFIFSPKKKRPRMKRDRPAFVVLAWAGYYERCDFGLVRENVLNQLPNRPECKARLLLKSNAIL